MKKIGCIAFFIWTLTFFQSVFAQTITLSKAPEFYQLYPRNSHNLANVDLEGRVNKPGYDHIVLKIYQDGQIKKNQSVRLNYKKSQQAGFSFGSSIQAGLYQYKFELYLSGEGKNELCFSADSIVCGDAYIITGQSNSHASSSFYTYTSPFCRSFGVKTGFAAYDEEDKKVRWGRARGYCPGVPEGIGGWFNKNNYGVGVWGMHLMRQIVENYRMPVCIINGGSGSSSIEENMFYPGEDPFKVKNGFGKLAWRVQEAGLSNHLKAILWHQGETNTNEKQFDKYETKFDELYRSWNDVYKGFEKLYVFQLHQGCGGIRQSELREIQRKLNYKYNNVEVLATAGLPGHDGCHYSNEGYVAMAEKIFPLVARDFYKKSAFKDAGSPDIRKADYSKPGTEITLSFSKNVIWPDKLINNEQLEDYFYLNGVSGLIGKGVVSANKVILTLKKEFLAETITYLPGNFYNNTNKCFEGPWLMGKNGFGALSFHEFVIAK